MNLKDLEFKKIKSDSLGFKAFEEYKLKAIIYGYKKEEVLFIAVECENENTGSFHLFKVPFKREIKLALDSELEKK